MSIRLRLLASVMAVGVFASSQAFAGEGVEAAPKPTPSMR